jgi:hypothetical protein
MSRRFNASLLLRALSGVTALGSIGAILLAASVGHADAPSGEAVTQQQQAPKFRRLTEAQYRSTIADIFGPDIKVSGRFEPDMRVGGLLAAGTSAVSLTPAGAEQYEQIARGIAGQVVDAKHREKLVGCAPQPSDPLGAACAEGFFKRVGLRIYRRPLTDGEVKLAIAQALAASSTLKDFHNGLAIMLTAMLSDLPFLFQTDREVEDPRAPGGRTIDAWSRASKLSYFLWNSTPDEQLLQAAANGSLMTQAGLSAQVDRLMASPRFETGVRSFFDDFLQLEGMMSLSKDGIIYPAFRSAAAPAAREQTLRTITTLLVAENGDYRDLFTTRRVAMNRQLSPLYRMPYGPRDWSMVTLPDDDPRVGILTQISFLALHSHEGRSSPTLRGKAVREVLMCEHVPAPPANVNFTIVQDTSNPAFRTTRERLKAHLDDEECASCHKLTDPMGLTLDSFDGAGQFRATENGVPIDTTGMLDQIAFSDSAGLGKALHDNSKVTQCLTQSAWRYAAGRALLPSEELVTSRLHEDFARTGYRIRSLFRRIALDPQFFAVRSPSASRVASKPSSGRKG